MDENISQPAEDSVSAEPPLTSVSEDVVAQLNAQLQAQQDKHVRLLAEFDNVRKRHAREREDLIKYAHHEVIVECLKLYDDLERSLKAFKAQGQVDVNLLKGLEMIYANFKALMDKYDVKPIEALGKPFDHEMHEVLMQQETGDHPDGHVMEVFETGYTLSGKVVRTAKVKVAKKV